MFTNNRPFVLSIAGFDPSGGAGISLPKAAQKAKDYIEKVLASNQTLDTTT